MSDKARILVQLDPDPQPSVFDRVVAIDAGVQQLFSYGNVTPDQVQGLVHGAIFTRGVPDLKSTAVFVGGSDVARGEALLQKVTRSFFGPMRVSVMFDANGANTTAAAAVLAARKHLDFTETTALILAGTGPVGQRAARLLAREGARVRLASRSLDRSTAASNAINQATGSTRVSPIEVADADGAARALEGVQLVIAAGAAGIMLLSRSAREKAGSLKVAIDLNAVPPLGLEGIEVMDKAKDRNGVICYGAIGVGGTKMKIHRAAIASLFTANDKVLDAEAIYELGKTI